MTTTDKPESAQQAARTGRGLPPGTLPVIVLLVASAFVAILNETIMSVALPVLMDEFAIAASTAQWLTTGFLLTMAVVIPLTGFLLQRVKLRTLFLVAMSLFAGGTLLAVLAPGFGVLVVARVVQASGTAIMMPLLMTTVLTLVAPDRRGRMMGIISIVIAVAPAVGPTVSGIILDALSWRWMFGLVLPLAAVALGLGAIWVRNVTETTPVRLDILSVIVSAIGFGGIVFGLSTIGSTSGGGLSAWIPLVVGVLALAAFVGRQINLQRTDSALLDLRTFRSSSFTIAVVLVVIVFMALLGSLTLLPMYVQQVLGLSALDTGLMMLPGGILMGVIAPVVGNLFDRYGPRPLITPGMIVAATALWGMTTFGEATPVWWVIAVQVTLNVGLGFVFTPLMTSALGSLPTGLYSHGTATFNTIQQVAGAAGTAVFISLMSARTASGAAAGAPPEAAMASGVHTAFLAGAAIATAAVLLAPFIKRAPEALEVAA
ncbi:DHA2 family lincomycin resistance protein-like MFS transporter [Brachybacterium sacelli]|uniref:DHA2 family lincomycin resistance protein-like MFS transporter n=1 Tax=Brachybacterium sacelli TaxID=173364 RepID=A0ABS4WVN2_9MICO|nr:DHA2 family lincomycin resistance protein-like MFS transporter [Brachybacterium sacelli]